MKPWHLTIAALFAVGMLVAVGGISPAFAQRGNGNAGADVPNNFPYEIKNGRRVPKGNRVSGPDGSWREEVRDGPCVTLKEKTAAGEYRETRKCD